MHTMSFNRAGLKLLDQSQIHVRERHSFPGKVRVRARMARESARPPRVFWRTRAIARGWHQWMLQCNEVPVHEELQCETNLPESRRYDGRARFSHLFEGMS